MKTSEDKTKPNPEWVNSASPEIHVKFQDANGKWKENPEFRHAIPMLNAPRRRFVAFDPKRHTEDMRDRQLQGYVEVFSHNFDGEAWVPNQEYADAPFEEKIVLTSRIQ